MWFFLVSCIYPDNFFEDFKHNMHNRAVLTFEMILCSNVITCRVQHLDAHKLHYTNGIFYTKLSWPSPRELQNANGVYTPFIGGVYRLFRQVTRRGAMW